MEKKIIVQKGLNDLKNSLGNLGYEVVDINDSSTAQAIIYMADGYDIEYHNNLASMNIGVDISNNMGTILINAAGKTTEEIDNIIKKKIYSPLFD
ncbi:MAG: YkuS family protein [Tissierellales bacterium]